MIVPAKGTRHAAMAVAHRILVLTAIQPKMTGNHGKSGPSEVGRLRTGGHPADYSSRYTEQLRLTDGEP